VGSVEAVFRLVQDGGAREIRKYWRSKSHFRRQMQGPRHYLIPAVPGPAALSWDGPGVLPDRREGLVLRPGEKTEVEVVLRSDPRELPVREDIPFTVRGLPTSGPGGEPWVLHIGAILNPEQIETPNCLSADFWEGEDPRSPFRLAWGWRRAECLIAWTDGGLVSPPIPIPRQGGIEIPLSVGGYLILVPELAMREEMGEIRLSRRDGKPLLVQPHWGIGEGAPRISVDVLPGAVLGPFPAGRYTFAVSVAGVARPDAVGTVRPDRLEVLSIGR
jgi:hypothetical protein